MRVRYKGKKANEYELLWNGGNMNKLIKRILGAVMAGVVAVSVLPAMEAKAAPTTTKLGNATVVYDATDGSFELSGKYIQSSGAMGSTTYDYYSPFELIVTNGIQKANIHDCTMSGTAEGMFSQMSMMREVRFSNVNTSDVHVMDQMFNLCSSLQTLDLSGLDTSNVVSMNKLFTGCTSLKILNLSGWVIGSDTIVSYMFKDCAPEVIYAPKTIGKPIPLSKVYYDQKGVSYSTLSASCAGKILTSTIPGASQLKGELQLTGTPRYDADDPIRATVVSIEGKDASDVLVYSWFRGTEQITNAKSTSYYPVPADVGKMLHCEVSIQGKPGKLVSNQLYILKGKGPSAPSGITATSTSSYGASDGKINGTTSKMEYSTYADFRSAKVCSDYATVVPAGTYYVRKMATDWMDAGAAVSVIVADGMGSAPVMAGSVKISGSVVCGSTLTAKASVSNLVGSVKYQWRRGMDDISGATASTYTTTKADINKTISCVVTSTKQPGSLISNLMNIEIGKTTTKVTATTSAVTLTWNEVAGADGYYIYRKIGTNSYRRIATIGSTTYVDVTAKYGRTYTYAVRAYSGGVKGTFQAATVTVPIPNPTASVAMAPNGVLVKWNAVKDATRYRVYRKAKGGSYKVFATVKTGNALEFLDTTAKAGVQYYYAVKALYGTESSSFKAVTIVAGPAPTTIALSNVTGGVQVSWTRVSGADGYYVYRKVTGGKYVLLNTATSTATKFVDKTAEKGTKYAYAVVPFKGKGRAYFEAKGITAK